MMKTLVPQRVLESSNIFQEFTEKSVLKQATYKKQIERFYSKFVSFTFAECTLT